MTWALIVEEGKRKQEKDSGRGERLPPCCVEERAGSWDCHGWKTSCCSYLNTVARPERGRRAGRSRTPSARATDFVHNTDWLGEGGSSLPWHLRPHPGLQAQDRSSDSQRRAAPLQSRVTANSARKKRTARGRGWIREKTRSTYLCGFYHKLEGAELTWMKLNVLLSLLVLSKNSLPLPLEVPECARVIHTPALDVRLSRKHPRAPWTPCSAQPPLKMVQVMSTRGHPTEQEAGPRRRLKVLSPTVGAGSAETCATAPSARALRPGSGPGPAPAADRLRSARAVRPHWKTSGWKQPDGRLVSASFPSKCPKLAA